MELVASHLKSEATRRTDAVERDLFARSAFNRYYYATFLLTRATLASFRAEWRDNIPHATMPELLRGKIKTLITKERFSAQKNGDTELVAICLRALSALEDLAKILDIGRATRTTADYNPEIQIDFSNGIAFRLNTISISDANSWPQRARGYLLTISLAWKQINV